MNILHRRALLATLGSLSFLACSSSDGEPAATAGSSNANNTSNAGTSGGNDEDAGGGGTSNGGSSNSSSGSSDTDSDAGVAASGASNDEPDSGTNAGGAGGAPNAGGDSTAAIDLTVTAGDHTQTLTSCSWADGTVNKLRMSELEDGVKDAAINCKAQETGSFTAVFTVELWFFSDALGEHDAADVAYACGAPNGVLRCDEGSVGRIKVSYQDGAAATFDQVDSVAASSKSGTFTIDSFDTDTGEVAGSVDFSMTKGDVDFAVEGTFSADLFDCGMDPLACDDNPN